MKIFDAVQITKPKRNAFDLSHEKKLSMNMGDLVPILHQEILPGDKIKVNSEILIRLAPMVAPIMHRVDVFTHYFFVPNRLLWSEWEDFITGGEDGLSAPTFPKCIIDGTRYVHARPGRLPDYFGVPTIPDEYGDGSVTSPLEYSALPFRAYTMIYNEYYRDQNLEDKILCETTSTPTNEELAAIQTMRKRAWEKDYFTSCLPWAQRGPEVNLPIGDVQLQYKPVSDIIDNTTGAAPADGNLSVVSGGLNADANSPGLSRVENLESTTIPVGATTVTELRKAQRLQRWLEKNARAGSRYIEQIFSHFGVKSSDARLQRPEYLGGGKNPVVISEVLNTAGITSGTEPNQQGGPQGNMSGHGISVGNQNSFSKSFEEHGQVIGIMSVIPKTSYQQGIDRSFLKFDKFDYFWPEFAHIGEQEVFNKELYVDYQAPGTENEDTFGYQSRYAEYKYKSGSVHGDMRTTLDHWHMGRVFSTPPALNEQFIHSDPRHDIFAVEDPNEHKLYVQIYNSVKALRPIPYFNNPQW